MIWRVEPQQTSPPREQEPDFFLIKKIFLIPAGMSVTGFQIYYGLVKVIHQLLCLLQL